MRDEKFQATIQTLLGSDAPRVWSLIVSVFGDLAQQQGDAISGAVLGEILSPVGVRAEAMRVALYRLRNEGWIETTKQGRTAQHHLSAEGIQQSVIASHRIYADAQGANPEWHVLCYPHVISSDEHSRVERLEKDGYIAISAVVFLANESLLTHTADAFVVQGEISEVPDWLSRTLVTPTLVSAFNDLSSALQSLDIPAEALQGLSPCQIATLRALIVHRWRKLVLRLPDVPDTLFGADFAGIACRAQVMRTLAQLPRPELSSLTRTPL